MLYGFLPTNDRKIIEAAPMLYVRPEKHPTRLLDFHDIFYVVEGRWDVLLEDEEIILQAGDIAMLPARFHHYGHRDCTANSRTIFIHFEAEDEDRPALADMGEGLLVHSWSRTENLRVSGYFQDIMKRWHSGLPRRELACSALLSLLLIELSESGNQLKKKRDDVILELLDWMRYDSDKFFSVEELAEKAGMSSRTLSSRFRAETGFPVHKYQVDNKLERIAAILRNDSYTSLKNLAYNFGFYDEYHLSAAFKKKFGVSPKKFR